MAVLTAYVQIKAQLTNEGLKEVVPVTPAWEIETWWYLWPEAVGKTNSKWERLTRKGNHGMISNAKEQLRRDLRQVGAREYEESDSRFIAENVLKLGIISNKTGTSASFDFFETRIRTLSAMAYL